MKKRRWYRQCGVGLEVNKAAKVCAWMIREEQGRRRRHLVGETVLVAGVLVPVAGLVLALVWGWG